MNRIIIFIIAIITTIIVLGVCGAGGGMMTLIALNGFSESAATPILIVIALIVLALSIALSTAASWLFVKARHIETEIRFWHVAGINAGVNILVIPVIIAIIALIRIL